MYEFLSRNQNVPGFDRRFFFPLKAFPGENLSATKPTGGLWSSPVNSETDRSEWHDFLPFGDWGHRVYGGVRFSIASTASVCNVTTEQDIERCDGMKIANGHILANWLEFAWNYDAFLLGGEIARSHLFSDWLVGTLVVFNPGIMVDIKEIDPIEYAI